MLHNASSLPLKLFSILKESECQRIDFIWFFLQNWRHFFLEKVNYHNVYVAVNNWLLPNGENFSFSLGKCKHFFVLLILYYLLSILNFKLKFVFTEIGTITAKCKKFWKLCSKCYDLLTIDKLLLMMIRDWRLLSSKVWWSCDWNFLINKF